MEQLQELHTRAMSACAAAVAQATPADLSRPTPCAGWTLADLLAHMTAQDRGFAGAARGAVTTADDWKPQYHGDDAITEYAEAAADVQRAIAEDGVLERGFVIPEFATDRLIKGPNAVRAHLIDAVVHGWDVARTLGAGYVLDDEVLAESLAIAESIPDADDRGGFFSRAVAADPVAAPLDRIVAHLGRSPSRPD
ncbi:MAG: TIGR03086 family protein [Hamadaea sp.]|uniref:TIGR03086 family metal-binding protein n=1 Tax=Hamadaea sp. TaxID=2024425 RepID=UPI0017E65EF4|nr:TIGR03086 family metal-binding protein [Hamadaea sp.]NUR72346.1 TIGR03086 family protein [Hamadaea sp.]NUT18453.1 TIGR03086 family protein [Hamadaea sp.]